MMAEQTIAINNANDIVTARQAGRNMARELGFGTADQTRLATAISELARNVCQHADHGVCVITDVSDAELIKIRVRVEDQGPGIADIDAALTEGFSTSGGLGLGLVGVKRLAHDFHIESKPGHTQVVISMVQRRLRGRHAG
ncbi:MAG: anti-sigma regulatory factor [Candidatus Entotheonella factor]|uniref:Anti-sigma regulatory factor n=1 Tax=Entotheonella factor TaxID=1429438 RepID=W4LJR4_ENTF1|nr:ATP-binding protein [Candidatus Entotheonella palauensis]ETW98318.1 MAG: anti-sigma regulatory factor [Candidatus Entotheonella factor]